MRTPPLPIALALCLAACSSNEAPDNTVDVANAASRAQSDIDNYAAAHAETPVAAVRPTPRATPSSTPTVVEKAEGDDAAPDAVVRRYAAAIGAGRYAEAWALWEGRGKASGMTQAAFAASFAKYASFDAMVGAPSDEDAGAGQRYVTVPVTVTGTLRSGAPFRLMGPVILHTVAAGIESDDPDAHAWRLRNSELKPRPVDAADTDPNPR